MAPEQSKMERDLLAMPVQTQLSEVRRAVEALRYVSTKYPYKVIPTNLLVRVAYCLTRTPNIDSDQVRTFKTNKMSTIRHILENDFKQGLVAVPGFGFRATVPDNWDDYHTHVVVRSARRAGKSSKRLMEVMAPVPLSKLSEENQKQFREYKQVSKLLTQGNAVKALLQSENTTEE